MHTAYVSILMKHCETGKYSFTTPNYNAKAPFHLVPGPGLLDFSESRFSGALFVLFSYHHLRSLHSQLSLHVSQDFASA